MRLISKHIKSPFFAVDAKRRSQIYGYVGFCLSATATVRAAIKNKGKTEPLERLMIVNNSLIDYFPHIYQWIMKLSTWFLYDVIKLSSFQCFFLNTLSLQVSSSSYLVLSFISVLFHQNLITNNAAAVSLRIFFAHPNLLVGFLAYYAVKCICALA